MEVPCISLEERKNTFKEVVKESPKESLEEFIMFGATQYGRAKGRDQKYGVAEIIKDLGGYYFMLETKNIVPISKRKFTKVKEYLYM